MANVSFKKADLLSLVDGEECDTLEKMAGDITGTSRWSVEYSLIFKEKASGKFYEAHYSRGATEQQDERPFEHDGDAIACVEVRPVEKVVIQYERVP